MQWYSFLILDLAALTFLFCLGMPIALAFFAVNIVSLVLLKGPTGLLLFIHSMFDSVSSFSLAALPMFILMGNILYEANAIAIMFDAVDKWIGKVRARLHVISVIVATVFSAIGGSGIGTTAMMGSSIFPEMNRRGYDKKLSAGAIIAGASLDPIIPPSNLAIIVAVLANVSIAKLLFSGVVPGLVLAGGIIIYVLIRVHFNPELAPLYEVTQVTFTEKLRALAKVVPFGIIIFLVIGLIMLGVATPTEAAATGVVGSLLVAAYFRRLTFTALKNSIFFTTKIFGMVLVIMASAAVFSQVLALTGAARGIVELVSHLSVPRMVMFAIMQFIPLFLCCFMDQISLMMILAPIYIPIVETLKFDPIWFWCVILINITLGAITPPFGYCLFTLKGTTDEMTLEEIYRAVIPFVFLYIFGMLIVTFFPPLATWLPSKLSK
jgi:tripartite ATP-independent transporter DctM subunit